MDNFNRAQKPVCVVDPYSSGRFLVQELVAQNFPIICVRSTRDLSRFFMQAYDALKHHYIATVDHQEFEGTLSELRKFDVQAVIAGSEPGVELADKLSERLSLLTNGSELSDVRRDKYLMHEQLRKFGVRCCEQCRSDDPEEILNWCRNWNKWPVVIKPPASCGSDGVHICANEAEVLSAFDTIFGVRNPSGKTNDKILVQEFLAGTEFVVDTVSFEGRHLLNHVWVYGKKYCDVQKTKICDHQLSMPADGEVQTQLTEYVYKCLDALGIRFGAAHTEVMLCSDGPVLVEVNARMHGLQGPQMMKKSCGIGQHELVVDVFTGGRVHSLLYESGWVYKLRRISGIGVMHSPVEGVLCQDLESKEVRGLPSVVGTASVARRGQRVQITRDLNSAPGFLLLLNDSKEQLLDDMRRFRDLERSLYVVEDSDESTATSDADSDRGQ